MNIFELTILKGGLEPVDSVTVNISLAFVSRSINLIEISQGKVNV
jgi:hypothetical protein